MTTPEPAPDSEDFDVTRRTWLASERTWLAWWRTGLGSAAVAVAVGRVVPSVTHGTRWPYRLLGLGYATLSVAVLVIGAWRQKRVAEALDRGGYAQLSSPVVMWLTAAAALLATGTLALVAAAV